MVPISSASMLLAYSFWPVAVAAASCSNGAIELPIADIQVDPDIADSFMRGIPVQIGTPPQHIVVLPWADLNNTWIYDQELDCDKTIIYSDHMCEVRRGWPFLEDDSTTFKRYDDVVAAGGASSELTINGTESGVSNLIGSSLAGTDHFAIGKANLTAMPIGIPRSRWDHGYTILHALGMGSNSTYLNSLVQAGEITSRVWSIFWGRMWIDNPVNGSVVVGGYDSNKIMSKNNNHTQALDYSEESGCWTGMKVTISDVEVNHINGNAESIFSDGQTMEACIVPQRQLLWGAPYELQKSFMKATELTANGTSMRLHWGAVRLNQNRTFSGDISFTLKGGLKIRIPNSQYILPDTAVYHNGSRLEDTNWQELLISNAGSGPVTLGRYFLTAAYLMVDYDAGDFTLWQANPSGKSELVSMGEQKQQTCSEDESSVDSDGSSGKEGTESSNGLQTGAIAGIAVGAVAAVALIAVAAWFFVKKRKGAATQSVPPAYSPMNEAVKPQPETNAYPAEVDGQTVFTPAEVEGQQAFVHELDGGHYGGAAK